MTYFRTPSPPPTLKIFFVQHLFFLCVFVSFVAALIIVFYIRQLGNAYNIGTGVSEYVDRAICAMFNCQSTQHRITADARLFIFPSVRFANTPQDVTWYSLGKRANKTYFPKSRKVISRSIYCHSRVSFFYLRRSLSFNILTIDSEDSTINLVA